MYQNNFGGFYGTPFNNVWNQTPFLYNFGGNVPYNVGCNLGQFGWNNVPVNFGTFGNTLPVNFGTTFGTGNFAGYPWQFNNLLQGGFGTTPVNCGTGFGFGSTQLGTLPVNTGIPSNFTNQHFGWPVYNGVGLGTFGGATYNCR